MLSLLLKHPLLILLHKIRRINHLMLVIRRSHLSLMEIIIMLDFMVLILVVVELILFEVAVVVLDLLGVLDRTLCAKSTIVLVT